MLTDATIESIASELSGKHGRQNGKRGVISTEDQARLPVIAAYWYDHLLSQNPLVAEMITREDYIDSFCRWQQQPVLITTAGGTC